jgi:hypothetical protein
LKSAGVDIQPFEIDVVFSKFDTDNSGDISMDEFQAFLENEVKRLAPDFHKERVINPKAHQSFNKSSFGGTKNKTNKATKDAAAEESKSSDLLSKTLPTQSKANTSLNMQQQRPSSAKSAAQPRLSKTEPSRPTSAYHSSATARSSASLNLNGNDNKLIDTIRGITGNNPLVTKSMDIPTNKRLYTTAGGSEKLSFDSKGAGSIGVDSTASPFVTTSLTVSKESIASAHQASLVVDILQNQAHLESQLGSKYYN